MLLFKFCFIFTSFLTVEVRNMVFVFVESCLKKFLFEASLFGGLFFGGKAKKDDTPVVSSDDRQKEIDAIRKEISSNNAPPPVSCFFFVLFFKDEIHGMRSCHSWFTWHKGVLSRLTQIMLGCFPHSYKLIMFGWKEKYTKKKSWKNPTTSCSVPRLCRTRIL